MMREIKGEPEDTNIYYSTGLPSLDRRFGTDSQDHSGIPGGSLVLIHLPPESNLGSLFAQKVVMNLLETYEGGRTYYMHSSRPQHIVLKEFNAYGWDISKFQQEKRWEFIDMWHITSSHVASSSKIGKIDIRRKAYLKQAFQRMLKVHQTDNVTCFSVIDNLLWLKEDNFDLESSRLLDFFKDITDIISLVGGLHFLILPKGILSDTAEKIIMSIVNGIFDFSRAVVGSRNQDRMSIVKMMGVNYQSEILDITPDKKEGLRIESTGKL